MDSESAHHELETEIDDYLNDKERIRKILGRVGGVPQKKEKIVNYIFIFLVGLSFVIALIVEDPRNMFLEIALLLVSLKLIYVVNQNTKINHFQFWMLSTLEWRLNEMAKDLKKLRPK